MADSRDKDDGEAVSEGELEDGEVVSSDDEEGGGKDSKLPPEEVSPSALEKVEAPEPARDCVGSKRPAPEDTAPGGQEKRLKLDPPSPKTDDLEDGEIYSDDEEAAYFPQRVKSRSNDVDKKQTSPEPKSPTKTGRSHQGRGRERDNDRHSSPESTGSYHDRSYSSGYQRHRKDERSQSPQGVGFYEDRERNPENLGEGEEERRHHRSSSRTSYYSSPSHHGRRDKGNQSFTEEGDGGGSGYQYQKGVGGRKGGYHSYHHSKGQRYNYKGSHHHRYWDSSGRMLTGQAFNKLVREVKSRRDKGLPLLSIPGGAKPCNTLDQFNYPAPPSWYEEAVKEWDQKEEERKKNAGAMEEGGGVTDEGGQGLETQVPMEQGDGEPNQNVPPTAPAQQTGLSNISLAETGSFIPVNTPIPLFGYDTKVPQDGTLSSAPKPLFTEMELVGLEKGVSEQPAAVENSSEVAGDNTLTQAEEVERKDEEPVEAGRKEDSVLPLGGGVVATHTLTDIGSKMEHLPSTTSSVKEALAPESTVTRQQELVTPQPDPDDDLDYDTYLDQLDEEEEESVPGPVPANPLSEDFPLIAPGRQKKDVADTGSQSLKDLLIGGEMGSWSTKEETRRPGSKSTRRKQKDAMWRSRQKEWELQRHEEPPKPKLPCKYYFNGFCRHGDNCQYPHVLRDKKKEVCKFYLQDSCAKGDECLYYHGAFPCKFFHTKTICKNGDRCKFSHAPLTPEARSLLLSVLEPSRDPNKFPLGIPPMPVVGTNVHSPNILQATHTLPPVSTALENMSVNMLPLGQLGGSQFHSNLKDTESHPQVEAPVSSVLTSRWEIGEGGASAELAVEGLVVSIPRYYYDDRCHVSIPFSKIKGHSTYKQIPQSQSEDPTSKMANNQFPVPIPPLPQAMVPVVPVSMLPSFPPPPHPLNPPYNPPPGQGGPIPLFPPKPVEIPHVQQPFNSSSQSRRILLPTPPPHMRLNPEDLERMDSSVPEYWEAPNVNEMEHTPVVPPISPAAAPPLPPIPAPSVHYQGNEKGVAIPHLPPPLSLPQSGLAGGVIPRQGASGIELRPVAGPGMSPRQNISRMEPRPAVGGVVNPILHTISGAEVTATGPDPRQMHMERGPLPGGMDPRQVRMDPRHQQHLPQSPPRTFGALPPPPMSSHPPPPYPLPPSALLPSFPLPPPIAFYPSANPSAVTPPSGPMTQRPSPLPGSVAPAFGQHPPPHPGTSPVWGASSPEQQSRRVEGSRVGEGGLTLSPEPRRVDPRTKYAHLKIKAKSQGSSPSILKKGPGTLAGGEAYKQKDPAVEVPKLLQDPTSLDKPIDPRDLFVDLGIGATEDQEYGEPKTSFGGFKSYFSGTGSNKGSQEFGEITLHRGQKELERDHKTVEADREAALSKKDETAGEVDTAETNAEEGSAAKAIPSYLASLGLGAEDGLKIDSAFGSLENKKDDSSASSPQRQHDAAKKMPSIYGFGSEPY